MKCFFKRICLSFLIAVFLSSGISSLYAKPSNKVLRIGVGQEFEYLNPLIMLMQVTGYAYTMVNRPLMTLNEKSEWVPKLAKEIPTVENGKVKIFTQNGKKMMKSTWEIRENARWGDGVPVTGHDVKFTWEVALNNTVAVGYRDVYKGVERIEVDAANPKIVHFYQDAAWDYYQIPKMYILPKHLEEPVYKKHGDKKLGYEKNSLYATDSANPGLYNGPYLVEEIKLGSHIIVKPNPYFYGKKPSINKIIIKVIPSATLEANLISGNVDMIASMAMKFDQALTLEKRIKKEKLDYQVNYKSAYFYEHLCLNLNNPFLKDIKVRRALIQGLNRKNLVKSIFADKLQVALHDLSPSDPWFTDDKSKIKIYKYSKKRAQKLLDEAGWKKRSDGYRYNSKGEKLTFQLMTTAGNKTREMVQVYIQEQWKKIGVEVTIVNEPARIFFGQTVRRGKFPAIAMFSMLFTPDTNPRPHLHKNSIPTEANGWGGINFKQWSNDEVSGLIDAIDSTFSAERRTEMRHKILYHYTNELPAIPLYYRADLSVTPTNLTGYGLTGHLFSATQNVEHWNMR